MGVVVTQEIADRAKARGACRVPPVGTPIERLAYDHLVWAEDKNLLTPEEIQSLPQPAGLLFGRLPLFGFSGGSGYGDGSGCYGYGYGSGYGAGSYGYGDGDGSGRNDAGYGNDDGSGYYGSGYYGSGYGAGSGYGSGYGKEVQQ